MNITSLKLESLEERIAPAGVGGKLPWKALLDSHDGEATVAENHNSSRSNAALKAAPDPDGGPANTAENHNSSRSNVAR